MTLRWRRLAAMAVALLSPLAATATTPLTIQFQGWLTSAEGRPVAATVPVTFLLYAAAVGGAPLWQETHTVEGGAGVVRVLLGSRDPVGNPLDPGLFAGAERWLALQVGTDPEATPRLRLSSVPTALVANVAEGLEAGVVTGAMIANASITIDKLAWQCGEGQVLVMGASGWTCGPNPFPPRARGE